MEIKYYMRQVIEFLESKRVPMDLNPGLAKQLYDLDWRLQSGRLRAVIIIDAKFVVRESFV